MNTLKRIGTHSGTFHADEVTGMMFLKNFIKDYKTAEIVRTRDMNILVTLDLIIDVGNEYDPARHRYDHHQKGFFETFSDNHLTKLSSAGLIYKHFGEEILQNSLDYIFNVEQSIEKKYEIQLDETDLSNLKNMIYTDFIEYLDGVDNGISQYPKEIAPKYKSHYSDMVSRIARLNNRGLLKETLSQDELFLKGMEIAKEEFLHSVKHKYIEKYISIPIVKLAIEKRFDIHESGKIIFVEPSCSWKEALFKLEKQLNLQNEILFVLFHDKLDGNYRVQAVPPVEGSFDMRKPLHEKWRGIRDEELAVISGITDIVFCHNSGFIGGAKSFEGVLDMAKLSLN